MVKLHDFQVTGIGPFPMDMLRYDQCWPWSSDDAGYIQATLQPGYVGSTTVNLTGRSAPTVLRWSSFMWKTSPTHPGSSDIRPAPGEVDPPTVDERWASLRDRWAQLSYPWWTAREREHVLLNWLGDDRVAEMLDNLKEVYRRPAPDDDLVPPRFDEQTDEDWLFQRMSRVFQGIMKEALEKGLSLKRGDQLVLTVPLLMVSQARRHLRIRGLRDAVAMAREAE